MPQQWSGGSSPEEPLGGKEGKEERIMISGFRVMVVAAGTCTVHVQGTVNAW